MTLEPARTMCALMHHNIVVGTQLTAGRSVCKMPGPFCFCVLPVQANSLQRGPIFAQRNTIVGRNSRVFNYTESLTLGIELCPQCSVILYDILHATITICAICLYKCVFDSIQSQHTVRPAVCASRQSRRSLSHRFCRVCQCVCVCVCGRP